MSPRSVSTKQNPKKPNKKAEDLDPILILRLVAAAVLLAVASFVKNMPDFVRVILIVLSAAASAYDLFLFAIDAALDKDYLSDSLLVLVVTLFSLFFRFRAEGAAMVLVYRVAILLRAWVEEQTKKSGLSLLRRSDEESREQMEEALHSPGALRLSMEPEVAKTATLLLRLTMAFGVLYALVLPLISGFDYQVSIHRGLMILTACLPGSVVAALPLTALVGLCHSAGKGVQFHSASDLEKLANANLAVIDKTGVLSEGEPQVLGVQSAVAELNNQAFLSMAAHAAYYSSQPFAKAIAAQMQGDFLLDVLSDFEEIAGGGVKVLINGAPIILASAEVYDGLGISVPSEEEEGGKAYYMTLAGHYVGKILLSAPVSSNAGALIQELRDEGLKRIYLVMEDGSGEAQRIGESLGVSEAYGDCDTERKLKLLDDLSQGPMNRIVYIYSNGIEQHSAAQVDLRVSRKARFADAAVQPEDKENVAAAIRIGKRMLDVASKNAIFVFVVKALLIFLSMLGYCKIWFVMFLDMAAMAATMLNAIRVTKESTLDAILDKILKR